METGHVARLRRRRDSNPQPRMKRRLVSTELHYRSATPPESVVRVENRESNPCLLLQAGALTTELHGHDAVVVVRGGIEPPASAVSERRSRPTELPDNGTPCGTRTRSSALKGQETNPYPNGAWMRSSTICCCLVRISNLNYPEPKSGRAADYPRGNGCLVGTCGGIRTPCARRQLLYRQPRLTVFASHARHHRLPEQDSNLQSRINNPLVYRLTDRGNVEAPG